MKLGPFTWREKLGDPDCPYIERWALGLGPLGSFRLHHWIRSDDKRAKHDHPSSFVTLVLKGSYEDWGWHSCSESGGGSAHRVNSGDWECSFCGLTLATRDDGHSDMQSTVEHMTPGKVVFRKAEHRHTVAVNPGGCWTLLYFFPERRKWGFWVRRKDGTWRWKKANKYFFERGHHPCDQP